MRKNHITYYVNTFIISVFLLTLSCSHLKHKGEKKPEFRIKGEKLYNQGLELMDSKNYLKAIEIFKSVSKSASDRNIQIGALYNISSSYEALNQCEKSKKYLKKILKKYKNPSIQIHVRLSLAHIYSCLQKDLLVIKTLKNILKQPQLSQKMDLRDKNLKIPAQIAGAYARLNRFKKHKHFFLVSQREWIEFLGSRKKTPKDEELESMIFYYSGDNKLASYKRKITHKNLPYILDGQMILMNSICLRGGMWSDKSYEAIDSNYSYLRPFIRKSKTKKSLFKKHIEKTKSFINACEIKHKKRSLVFLIRKYEKILK